MTLGPGERGESLSFLSLSDLAFVDGSALSPPSSSPLQRGRNGLFFRAEERERWERKSCLLALFSKWRLS